MGFFGFGFGIFCPSPDSILKEKEVLEICCTTMWNEYSWYYWIYTYYGQDVMFITIVNKKDIQKKKVGYSKYFTYYINHEVFQKLWEVFQMNNSSQEKGKAWENNFFKESINIKFYK